MRSPYAEIVGGGLLSGVGVRQAPPHLTADKRLAHLICINKPIALWHQSTR